MKEITSEIKYISMVKTDDRIVYQAVSARKEKVCPYCGMPSTSRHSKFRRLLQDLPYKGKAVFIDLENCIMKCKNPNCEYDRFTEEFSFAPMKAKLTNRLIQHVLDEAKLGPCRKVASKLNEEGIIIAKTCVNKILSENGR